MTEQEVKTKLETLEQWELVDFWVNKPTEATHIAEKLFQTDKALNEKVLRTMMRAYQYHVGDIAVFEHPYTDIEPMIHTGTVGKITEMSHYCTKKGLYKMSIEFLINDKKVRITRGLSVGHVRLSDLRIRSIGGYWFYTVSHR